MAFAERRQIEPLAGVAHQVELLLDRAGVEVRVERSDLGDAHRAQRPGLAGVALEQPHAAALDLDGADEVAAAADRPVHRRGVERQRLLDLVEQIERVAALAVHLVDEGQDRDVAQPADLEQLAGARLDALGGVDHHHGGIDRRQRAVGVFGEVLVARRVEQVEDVVAVFEGHHRGDDRDAALALDRHPVGLGGAAVPLGLDLAGELDRAAEQQELLGQRGLAGVRMRDDGEGAAALDLAGERRSGSEWSWLADRDQGVRTVGTGRAGATERMMSRRAAAKDKPRRTRSPRRSEPRASRSPVGELELPAPRRRRGSTGRRGLPSGREAEAHRAIS